MDINKENLENALGNEASAAPEAPVAPTEQSATPQMPKEVEIGFHNGALQTLNGERAALIEMIQHVEARMQAHVKRMQELGVEFKQAEKKE